MTTWNIDVAHSEIGFKVKHLMVSSVKGYFGKFSGSLTTDDDTLTNAKVSFEAETASVNTNNAGRDGHMQSADFFDAAQFPKITFVSKSITKKSDNTFTVVGDFTMKGVTKEIEIQAVQNGIAKGTDGKKIMSLDVTGVIQRQDYGVSWNAAIEAGGVAVSNEVWLNANVEMKEE